MAQKTIVEYMDQFAVWRHYSVKHNRPEAYRYATARAKTTSRRMRLLDEKRCLLDLINP